MIMIDEDCFNLLLAQVEQAKRAYEEAKERFWDAAKTPRPDGRKSIDRNELIQSAVADETSAMNTYLSAMMRLNRYLLYGIVTDNVREQLTSIRRVQSIKSYITPKLCN